ncbi:Ribonucleases P/MRP protein subunit POP1 [Nymphon striatum]|nr:Ribonucleases P/MRP protein subunit POP1 [Nymphon striatum]
MEDKILDSTVPLAKKAKMESNGVDKTFDSKSVANLESVHVVEIAEARRKEISSLAAVTKQKTSNTRLMQTLPIHMRRRAMSHSSKRVPRRLRFQAEAELQKMKAKPKQTKCPSRWHRRRPSNLLKDYERRKRKNVWLETHIWHAKRFHMKEIWNYKLPDYPNDKSRRAAYRASVNYAILHDLSYYNCIELQGKETAILNGLSKLTSEKCGPTFSSKMSIKGNREGSTVVYEIGNYPYGAISKVTFLWKTDGASSDKNFRTLWIWVHPSSYEQIIHEFAKVFEINLEKLCEQSTDTTSSSDKTTSNQNNLCVCNKREDFQHFHSADSQVIISSLKDSLVRYRLTGPQSHSIITDVLNPLNNLQDSGDLKLCASDIIPENLKNIIESQYENWKKMAECPSASVLPSYSVFGLLVKDPRLNMPLKRKKTSMNISGCSYDIAHSDEVCEYLPYSLIWNAKFCDQIIASKKSNQEINDIRSEQILPASEINLNTIGCYVPVVLIQRPGVEDSANDCLGYSGGWDIILPSGWGMPFWISLVYRNARVGGLRELQSIHDDAGFLHVPDDYPDTTATHEIEKTEEKLRLEKYFKIPPAKRPNYVKFGTASPFSFPWEVLVSLCSRYKKLEEILPDLKEISRALIPLKISMIRQGVPEKYSMVCCPTLEDISELDKSKKSNGPFEKHHQIKKKLSDMKESDYLPVSSCINLSSRQVIGFMKTGRFMFKKGIGSGIGFVSAIGLLTMLQNFPKGPIFVFVRDTDSFQYRYASISVIC